MEQDIDVVLPIYRSVSPKELDSAISPSFDSTFLCNYFLVVDEKKEISVFTHIHYATENNPIKFIEEENRLIIGFENDNLQNIVRQAYNSYKQN